MPFWIKPARRLTEPRHTARAPQFKTVCRLGGGGCAAAPHHDQEHGDAWSSTSCFSDDVTDSLMCACCACWRTRGYTCGQRPWMAVPSAGISWAAWSCSAISYLRGSGSTGSLTPACESASLRRTQPDRSGPGARGSHGGELSALQRAPRLSPRGPTPPRGRDFAGGSQRPVASSRPGIPHSLFSYGRDGVST